MLNNQIRCYDNGGKTYDRYTVVFMDQSYGDSAPSLKVALGMSTHPSHPLGFGQYTSAMVGPHLGKQIKFEELPPDCQQCVLNDMSNED